MERRLREKVSINGMEFGFMPGKGKTNAIFVVWQMQEKFLAKKEHCFLHLWMWRKHLIGYRERYLGGWRKFKELSEIFARKEVSLKLKLREGVCEGCDGVWK